MVVLALDLASTTGFAVGAPGTVPVSGSVRFASQGSSHEAVFAAALKWMSDTMAKYDPSTVVWEAPLPTTFKRGLTNVGTTTLLYGLPAVIGACSYLKGVYDIRKASPRDVRLHFIGCCPPRKSAKTMTMKRCRDLGWPVGDDNEADALALWSFMCTIIDPSQAKLLLHRARR
jgi:hypothetical protein